MEKQPDRETDGGGGFDLDLDDDERRMNEWSDRLRRPVV